VDILTVEMSVDLRHSSKAVAAWLQDDTMRFLTKADPKTKSIILSAKFNTEAAFFDLEVPVTLKGLGSNKAFLRICASTIASLVLSRSPTAMPTGIQDDFNSTPLGLDFTLNDPPALIVSSHAPEPLSATRKLSRDVLDSIRDLSNTTTLSIYIEACDAPTQLQDISDAVSQGLFTSHTIQHHISSMYGGLGGKLLDLAVGTLPPSYDEAAASPPPPPPIDRNSKKRAREDSDSERKDNTTLLWDAIHAMSNRVKTLETENEKLKQKNTELSGDLHDLREKYNTSQKTNMELVEGMGTLQGKYDALEDRLTELATTNETFEDTYDARLVELRNDMDDFEGIVQSVEAGQITEESMHKIEKRVIEEMLRRLAEG
jgi:hypothetical protein